MSYLATARRVLAERQARNRPERETPYERTKETKEPPSGDFPTVLQWDRLAAQAPGGIIVDEPDRACMMAAVAVLGSGLGDAFEGPDEELTDLDAAFLDDLEAAGFSELDLDGPDGPAWVDDASLTVSLAEIRASVTFDHEMRNF
jgi:hypothetical protein